MTLRNFARLVEQCVPITFEYGETQRQSPNKSSFTRIWVPFENIMHIYPVNVRKGRFESSFQLKCTLDQIENIEQDIFRFVEVPDDYTKMELQELESQGNC